MTNARANELQSKNTFYRDRFGSIIWAIVIVIVILLMLIGFVVYQLFHRPLPRFYAVSANGQQMELSAFDEPNLYSSTLITWASKAAVAAYTFSFANYDTQLLIARPYFTDAGWTDSKIPSPTLFQP